MRILGFDPGTRIAGYGVVDVKGNHLTVAGYGIIDVRRESPFPKRLLGIYQGIEEIVGEFKPDTCAIEMAYVRKNIQSALRIGEGRGCAILAMAMQGLDVAQYAPSVVKKAVTGRGLASKHQVQGMIRTLLNIREENLSEDASDALAVAVCHCHRISCSRVPSA